MSRHSAWLALACAATACAQWLDVPYVKQTKEGCGSAAVAMVIQYWAAQHSRLDAAAGATERIESCLRPDAHGIEGKALKAYFEAHGFQAFILGAEFSDLEHHLRRGRPVIACLAPDGPRKPLHYVVVTGIDGGTVWMNDPARGKLTREDRASFQKEWKATGNWALLAVPRT